MDKFDPQLLFIVAAKQALAEFEDGADFSYGELEAVLRVKYYALLGLEYEHEELIGIRVQAVAPDGKKYGEILSVPASREEEAIASWYMKVVAREPNIGPWKADRVAHSARGAESD